MTSTLSTISVQISRVINLRVCAWLSTSSDLGLRRPSPNPLSPECHPWQPCHGLAPKTGLLTDLPEWPIILPVRKGVSMESLATTRMSSKGQVVIPEEIRDRLGLKAGTQFVVLGNRDVVILKAISAPSVKEFNDLIGQARQQARRAGLRKSDVEAAVARVRGLK